MNDDIDRAAYRRGINQALARMRESTRRRKAVRLDVSLATIDNWQSGATFPSEANLARLANASGTTQEAIRTGAVQ
ncbi:hypothetical protein [Pseudonocardia sp. NPDC046786]|uniref:hypothetical protein n=1 Tax=Pseudonocardia sp. NPDC046786 TaxID=3155471 RepID=UPI00340F772C